ncbi:glycosyl transferase, family 2 [Desulforamulus reducens MI-1]|uniref:Glycosyl transferase, family 2 n=1 Tax=Desulforamulus reducens (strain ATCC BAA-1160 / DSM 100696 / MI-1) TaxID=349161 RepID=A4J5R6_DESRM|nr:glycosyltransferase family 2 protein [Desulforamulus reducens]ABO50419.1 glycosyl transferase, family 2 [Desulforamulus reducens MI-1]
MITYHPKLSMIIPFYNEEENVERVVLELQQVLEKEQIKYELILVNNGSTDKTGWLLDDLAKRNSGIKVITVSINHGYGWGIINGLRWACGDYLGFMGGDGQIDPSDVSKVFNTLLEGKYHLCKVNRCQREDGPIRKLTSHIFNRAFVYTFKVNVGDINGSPKIMSRTCYEQLNLCAKDWFLDAEVILKSQYLNFSIGEVPVAFHRRMGGHSSVRIRTVWEFIKNMAFYRKRGVFYESSDFMWGKRDPA